MDNGSSHTSRVTRAWLSAHPRLAVTYTPKHASWLNIIEQWFGVLTRRLLRRGDFTSRDDLEAKINGATTPTPSTPVTSNAIRGPKPCPSCRKPHDRNAW